MLATNITNFSSVRAKVELYLGSTLVKTCTCEDVLQEFDVTRDGDQGKFFGFGVSHKLNLTLIDLDDSNPITLTTANSAEVALGDGSLFLTPYPKFEFTEVNRDEKSNSIKATAYDAVYKASSRLYSELNINTPYTLRALAQACATLLGVSLRISVNDGSFDISYEEGGNYEGTETIRAVLNHIAEVTQTIYFIDSANELVFKRLNRDGAADLTIHKADYYELTTKTNRTLVAICNATELGDNITATTDAEGITQYVRDNPLWELRADLATLLETAVTRIGGLTINQFNCDWSGNYLLEVGDKIALTTNDGGTVVSFVLCDVAKYDGTFSEVTSWSYTDNSDEKDSNPVTIGDMLNQTSAKVDKLRKEITLHVSDSITRITDEQTAMKNEIAELNIKSERISASVSSVEKTTSNEIDAVGSRVDTLSKEVELKLDTEGVEITIERVLEEGVEKVVTASKKYTFDDSGLNISSNDSNISTVVTEDGMRIYRNSSEVLTADNSGVKAEDLHATTYLIIGKNSRLEDRGNRTACFWIGGL